MYTQKSFTLKTSEKTPKWYLVDATDMVVGRLATQVANILSGKSSTRYTRHIDAGDFVVVVNADKVKLTGKKWDDKVYYTHSGYIGGLKERTAKEQLEKRPDLIVYNAVKGMLPKSTLGRKQLTKLRVFAGENHEHEAQKPEKIELKRKYTK